MPKTKGRKTRRIRTRNRRARVALRRLAELPTRPPDAVIPPYSRTAFGGGWDDLDADGQDERAEVLIAAHRPGRGRIKLELDGDRVISGRWRCRFSGAWITDAGDMDVDHLIPLKDAWESGAHEWSPKRRRAYANGIGIISPQRHWLLPVTAKLNRAKGDKSPDEWMPPNTGYHVNYAADWILTKSYWSLSVTAEERAALTKILEAA